MDINETLKQAINWYILGVAIIPIKPRSKVAAVRWQEYQNRLPSPEELVNWFESGSYNLAIVTGRGLVVIDFDTVDTYMMWAAMYKISTYQVITGRGVHAYFWCDQPVQTTHIPGLGDIKAAGGYVLAPPSIHPSGAVYQVLMDAPITRINRLDEVIPLGLIPEAPKITHNPGIAGAAWVPTSDPWESALNVPDPSLDLVTVVRQRVTILSYFPDATKTGPGWYIARCPLHDDHNPSLWIDTNRGVCGCFAGCNNGKPMDIVNLHASIHGLSNRDSMIDLVKSCS